MPKRLIVGITGATGAIYGISLLRALKEISGWESHLVLTDAGVLNVWHEHKMKRKEVEKLADFAYHPKDIAATIASGSFITEGMVIAPISPPETPRPMSARPADSMAKSRASANMSAPAAATQKSAATTRRGP